MAADPGLVRYIRTQVEAGFGKEQVYQAVLAAGWTKEQVNEAIYEIMGKRPGAAQPSMPAPAQAQPVREPSSENSQVPGFFWKLKNVLIHPGRFFQTVKPETGIGNAFIFMLVISFMNVIVAAAILMFAVSMIAPLLSDPVFAAVPYASFLSLIMTLGVIYIFGAYALSIGVSFLLVGITNVFVSFAGGKKGFYQTFKGLAYSGAPGIFIPPVLLIAFVFLLSGTIDSSIGLLLMPFSLFIGLWSLYLAIRGISAFQEISAGRAFTAIVFTGIVLIVASFILVSLLASMFLMSYFAPLM